MNGFRLALAANTSLEPTPDGYFLISRRPLRALRVNRALFNVLERLRDGTEVDFTAEILRLLLDLVSKGYLEITGLAGPAEYPPVSIIVPVKDQPEDLRDCLRSLQHLDWPAERREVIVVDDGSTLPVSVATGISLLRHDASLGPAACRNLGARQARGDILAFLDADCLAGEGWLWELVPFFVATGVGAVGGYVAGYYRESFLDRYEDAGSSLNMGRRLILEGRGPSTFYVPTANLLVRRDVFMSTGGFDEQRRVGEDVDLCWRLRSLGYGLVYAPFGRVAHKHRNRLGRMLKRRAEYGTSEAGLYRAHRDKTKAFVVPVFTGLSFLALALAVLLVNPYPLIAVPFLVGLDAWRRSSALGKAGLALPFRRIIGPAIRSGLSLCYFALFHLVRYYLVPLLALGFLWHPVWALAGLALAATSLVDFFVKKPALPYPVFLFFYLLEHLAYQAGVFLGCLKAGYFGSYRVSFRRASS
jgi:mycofactocin system glycosyltransferase